MCRVPSATQSLLETVQYFLSVSLGLPSSPRGGGGCSLGHEAALDHTNDERLKRVVVFGEV